MVNNSTVTNKPRQFEMLALKQFLNENKRYTPSPHVVKSITDTYLSRIKSGKEPVLKSWLESGDKSPLKVEKKPTSQTGRGVVSFVVVSNDGKWLAESSYNSREKGSTKAAREEAHDRMAAIESLRKEKIK